MNIETELQKFTAHAKAKKMDLSGDKDRWFSLKTARAWTAWLATAKTA